MEPISLDESAEQVQANASLDESHKASETEYPATGEPFAVSVLHDEVTSSFVESTKMILNQLLNLKLKHLIQTLILVLILLQSLVLLLVLSLALLQVLALPMLSKLSSRIRMTRITHLFLL